MKGRYLFFAACLGCLAFRGAMADDDASVARAARRTSSTVTAGATTAARGKSASSDTARTSGPSSRTTSAVKSNTVTGRATTARTATDKTSAARTTVSPRGTQGAAVQSRPVATTARTATSTVARTAMPTRASASSMSTRTAVPARTAIPSHARAAATTTTARTATNTELRDAIMGRDYKTCRQVYYECMDEFCANKDAQLKRCACSSRLHEFDRVKKQLANVDEKLLDFNQRLLTVNMDKEDAEALFTATEGELAFNQKDTSASKKILDEISKKLNSGGNDSFSQNLSAISLSLNTDAAFDSVDSLMGASTTTKEGVELYNAALPVCREMAAEVCDEESLALAASGYQMAIEQDCNTIAKTYETQTDQAREKIREGSALLDISRLDIYQKRNSDDILTCKKKMLDQLYDTSVCGTDLDKCLDMSGQYIDPSTGQAFLTENLANLNLLITRPEGGQTWTGAPGNDRFVSYLNSKKKYLEPAMENCQDISDYVWNEFIEDALSQIKLAQESKLEEVRQSCTTLTAQCLADTAKSIADFDARALSTFGVKADKTVNDMCNSVKVACTALLETIGGDQDWVGGMTSIATEKTYETIMQTCREVGRACIIQACKSISGNFGMCESTQNSINRKSIINRTSCWPEVKECVREAGEDAIKRIFEQIETDTSDNGGTFYKELYAQNFDYILFTNNENDTSHCYQTDGTTNCIYDLCITECGCTVSDEKLTGCTNTSSMDCRVCRLTEKIWGNCEAAPVANITLPGSHNKILIPRSANVTTLLSWFAQNTNTSEADDSCRDTSCPSGYRTSTDGLDNIICVSDEDFALGGMICPKPPYERFYPSTNNRGDCCRTGTPTAQDGKPGKISSGNCCIGTWKSYTAKPTYGAQQQTALNICNNNTSNNVHNVVGSVKVNNTTMNLVCISSKEPAGKDADTGPDAAYPQGKEIHCDGQFVFVDSNGTHVDPHNEATSYMSYINDANKICTYDKTSNEWKSGADKCTPEPTQWLINLDGTPIGQ
ncbi:MAG: hypothetical protein K2L25_04055 [Alphaproteobacteria bacterium]|nr:hypothetical protein [Alphaproteobacteria bacterium]